MCGRRFVFVLLSLLVFSPLFSQGAEARAESLGRQSSTIRDSLVSIREQSRALSEELTSVQERLAASEEERRAFQEQSTRLSDSLTSINGQLSDCYSTIQTLEQGLRRSRRAAGALTGILLVLVLMKALGYWLYFKGVSLPRWLDVLL